MTPQEENLRTLLLEVLSDSKLIALINLWRMLPVRRQKLLLKLAKTLTP